MCKIDKKFLKILDAYGVWYREECGCPYIKVWVENPYIGERWFLFDEGELCLAFIEEMVLGSDEIPEFHEVWEEETLPTQAPAWAC